jgi:hypothetical protein
MTNPLLVAIYVYNCNYLKKLFRTLHTYEKRALLKKYMLIGLDVI